jgi:uncharacterized protein (TIGR02246 family)
MTRFALGMVTTLALALAGAALAKDAGHGTAAGSPPLDDRLARQLQPTLKAFEDAWNRHDPDAMAAAFADDAVIINPSGRVARGRAEITQLFEDEHQRGMMKGTRFSQRVTGAREVAPGLVFVDEDMTLSGARDPSGQALPDQHVHGAMLVAKQQDGRWRVIEGRPYLLAPAGGSRGLAAASRAPQLGGTGSGAAADAFDIEDTAHTGP